jgi:hypothetical protein
MNKDIKSCLAEAVSATLENMAFQNAQETIIYTASIPVKSPNEGTIKIFAPSLLLKELSESIYSIDTVDIDEKLMLDVLAELANTIAGHFMESLLQKDQIFELGVPETEICEEMPSGNNQSIYLYKTGESIIGAVANFKNTKNKE